MRYSRWLLVAVLGACVRNTPTEPGKAAMTDDLPVSNADLRALFELLDEESGNGYECDHGFTLTRRFLAERRLPVEDVLRWLGENGAGCDCEVIFNVEQQWGAHVGFEPEESKVEGKE